MLKKVNFGCGENKLPGWENYDAELDITKRLPFEDRSVAFAFAEHVVEHVDLYQAIGFFKELVRILKPGGVFRIVVPSIEQIFELATPDYCRFTERWQTVGPTKVGAMHAILFSHGHRMAWTESLLVPVLRYSGFEWAERAEIGRSMAYPELVGVEGHGRVIGDKFNAIESLVVEATKRGD